MNNKLLNIIFIISIVVLIPTAIWGLIYEYLIFDKSVITSQVFNITMAIGYSSLFGLIFSVILDRIIDKYNERKQTKKYKSNQKHDI